MRDVLMMAAGIAVGVAAWWALRLAVTLVYIHVQRERTWRQIAEAQHNGARR